MAHYIVSKRNYEYNDEGYDRTEGGTPVYVGDTRKNAKEWMNEVLISEVKNGDLYIVEGYYLDGNALDEYIENFGDDGLNISDGSYGKYAYIDELPDMKDWSDEQVLKYVEVLELDPYFITEV